MTVTSGPQAIAIAALIRAGSAKATRARMVQRDPGYPCKNSPVLYELGGLPDAKGQSDEASWMATHQREIYIRRQIGLAPPKTKLHCNLGNACQGWICAAQRSPRKSHTPEI